MAHNPHPASCNDCGQCETCQQTDDYSPAWANPAYPAALTASQAVEASTVTPDPERPRAALLGRDGGEHA